jgi:hypothetical protein
MTIKGLMMKNSFLALTLSLALAGCVTDQMAPQYNACNAYQRWVDKAQCMNNVAATDGRIAQDPGSQEIIAYRKLLIEKVRRKKISDAEAEYAFQQKIGEMNQRLAQQRALNQLSQPITIQAAPAPAQVLPQLLPSRPMTNTTCQQIGNQVSCQSF